MKKQFLKTIATRFVRPLALVAILATAAPAVQAQTATQEPAASSIKYVGVVDGQLVFQFNYANADKELYTVEVKDDNGFVFYSNTCKDKTFQKRFAIAREEAENNTIVFVVAANGKESTQTFRIGNSKPVVEEVVAARK